MRYVCAQELARSIPATKTISDVSAAASLTIGFWEGQVSYMYVFLLYACDTSTLVCTVCPRCRLRRLSDLKSFYDALEHPRWTSRQLILCSVS